MIGRMDETKTRQKVTLAHCGVDKNTLEVIQVINLDYLRVKKSFLIFLAFKM